MRVLSFGSKHGTSRDRRKIGSRSFFSFLTVICAGAVVTILVFVNVRRLEEGQIQAGFERLATVRLETIDEALSQAEEDLSFLNNVFVSVPGINEEQFRNITKPLLEHTPSIQNFAFHRIVPGPERRHFEAKMRREHPGFSITEIVDGRRTVAPLRSSYRVIEYVAPIKGNEAVLGLNVSTREAQRVALSKACHTGRPALSQPYQLVQQGGMLHGFVMLMPVYQRGAIVNEPTLRCSQVVGYTTAVFNGDVLIRRFLTQRELSAPTRLSTRVYLDSSPNSRNLVYYEGRDVKHDSGPLAYLLRALYGKRSSYSKTFTVAGVSWHVDVSAPPDTIPGHHLASLLALIGGILLTLVVAFYVYLISWQTYRVNKLMERRSAQLARMRKLYKANRNLDVERTRLLSLFEQAPGFVALLEGPLYVFTMANPAYFDLVGNRSLIGQPIIQAIPEIRTQGFLDLLDGVYRTGIPYVGKAVPVELQADAAERAETRYVDFVCQPIVDDKGAVTGIFIQGNDVSGEQISQRQLQHLVTHDVLTNLPNYTLLLDRIEQAIARAADRRETAALMVMDLDRFELVNESLGHGGGDAVLRIVARRLQERAKSEETVARTDGDRFVLVTSTNPPSNDYASDAQRFLSVLGEAIELNGQEVYLTGSVGIALYPDDAQAAEPLLLRADKAVAQAKEYSGNTYQFYKYNMNVRSQERLKLTSSLRNALAASEFVLYYQPQVSLTTGGIVGVEALIRWQHPEFGLVSPAEFIGLAEDAGLIVPIGEWVLRTACSQAKAWQELGIGPSRISVNLSALQFADSHLAANIMRTLKETGLDARCLDLELTESVVMVDVEHAIAALTDLKELGVQLSIDDFGTGYSSLSYLKRFPIDVLKIDRSFISEIPADANGAAISDAIISMAHSLGIKVIAEGVETPAQCEFLANNMCDEMQGYLFSAPLATEEMTRFFKEAHVLPEHLLRMHKPPRTLLLVDDEPSILSALKRQLRRSDYRIMTAGSGKEGLNILESNDIDVIVSDQRMPGMTGVEFLRTVKTLYPDTVRIVLSGFTELQSVTDAVNEGAIYKFLTKPWEDEQLREHIKEAFEHKEMVNENRRLTLEIRATNQELARTNRQLEEVLARQRRQIRVGEVSLDIVREALQNIPLPVLGLDEEDMIVLANGAAQDLFREKVAILGMEAGQVMPELLVAVQQAEGGRLGIVELPGRRIGVTARSMGNGTQSRGRIIILHDLDVDG